MSKSGDKIRACFPEEATVILADGDYAAPTSEFLFEDPLWVDHWRGVIMTMDYAAKHDCDDFAFEYKVCISRYHAESDFPNDGFAVGVLFYCVGGDSTKGHAINWALTEDVGLVFIEPQTGKQVELTKEEFDSICFVYG